MTKKPTTPFWQTDVFALLQAATDCGFKVILKPNHAKQIMEEMCRLTIIAGRKDPKNAY